MYKFFKIFLFLACIVCLDLKAEDAKQSDQQKIVDNKFLMDGRDRKDLFFQESNTDIMTQIVKTHDVIFITMTVIFVLCCGVLLYIIFRFSEKRNAEPQKFTHNTMLEVAWTAIPLVIVGVFAFYNLKTLYNEELQGTDNFKSDLVIKVVGHQWYWTYEYSDDKIKFDSYMIKDEDLKEGDKRLLSVDNPIYVPVGKTVKVLITADDVIHSWAIPAFGVKKDAVPGRHNETWFKAEHEGIFYGQCSELCGILHGFMPIEVRVVSDEKFASWKKEMQSKYGI